MLIIVVLAIAVSIGTVVHYQIAVKRHQRRLYEQGHSGKATRNSDEILSLDEDDRGDRELEPPPSTALILASIGLTLLIVLYWLFLYEPADSNIDDSYETLALRHLGEVLTANEDFKEKQTPTLVIVPPDIYRQLLSAQSGREQAQGADKEKIKDPPEILALREVLTKANNFSITAVRPSVPIIASRANEGEDWSLQGRDLQALLRDFADVQLVITLASYTPTEARGQSGRRDRNYYLAVFERKSLLYEYLDLVEANEVDLAFVSKGTYDRRQEVPEGVDPDRLVDKHFLRIVPSNVRNLRSGFRQYIGPAEYDPEAFCE